MTPTTKTLLHGVNAEYLESLYAEYLAQPQGLDPNWRAFFQGLSTGQEAGPRPAPLEAPLETHRESNPEGSLDKQAEVSRLVLAYRRFGYAQARLDPLERPFLPHLADGPDLSLAAFGLDESDLDTPFATGNLAGAPRATLREIVRRLQGAYCGTLGVEYMNLRQDEERRWIMARMEDPSLRQVLAPAEKLALLGQLTQAELFERFLQTRFVGQKRFSLEGAETLIPLLNGMVAQSASLEIEEMVLGMPHRGRLNVLTNVMGKDLARIFAEFDDNPNVDETTLAGDVKYHLGFSHDHTTATDHTIHLSLSFNPSHLEAVNPVVEGNVRARQERRGPEGAHTVCPVLIHGDAAFAGQGTVAETLNLSQLEGYRTGGTIHIIVNNHIGFTTNPRDSRSYPYPSDLAKMLLVPVFHVNGDDPEAALAAARLAVEYRQTFHRDVVIDLFCYRRLGHNEMDEPGFTQPLTTQRIAHHPTTLRVYAEQLLGQGTAQTEQVAQLAADYTALLEAAHGQLKTRQIKTGPEGMGGVWEGLERSDSLRQIVVTDVNRDVLAQISQAITQLPAGFHVHPRLEKLLEQRREMGQGSRPVDWGMAELLAYGSLVYDGYDVRLSGQDSRRGTFSHRHANLVDVQTGQDYLALCHLPQAKGRFAAYDSPLSEAAVLGFEFGYSLAAPHSLTLWEAQFGDFANGAQVIIDQFLAASEEKWLRMSGLVLLLPHGYEGQGAEHSSARPERFLQMCANNNLQVCWPSTPAQMFHLLRRQMHQRFRKPLVVMTPKSLLRLPLAVSSLEDLIHGHYRELLWDKDGPTPETARRVIFCSGKVFYELEAHRRQTQQDKTLLLRLEQLYPFPTQEVTDMLTRLKAAQSILWVQEEPENMGAWRHVQPLLAPLLPQGKQLIGVYRPAAAAPAVGSHKVHHHQQEALLKAAFGQQGD